MSNIDKKLEELFYDYGMGAGIGLEDFQTKIKKIFKEAGYVPRGTIIQEATEIGFDNIRSETARVTAEVRKCSYMTAQEWYDRFEKEMDLFPFNMSGEISYSDAMDVARRAAGLE